MFNSAYETRPCTMYRMDEVYKSLQLALVSNDSAITRPVPHIFATGQGHEDIIAIPHMVVDGAVGIPIFVHPVVIELPSQDKKHKAVEIVVDGRDVTKRDYNDNWKPTVYGEYSFLRTRLALQARWSANILATEHGAPTHHFAMRIYARWITDLLSRRFNLDLDNAVRTQALAGFMYLSMHQPKKELKDYDMVDIAMKISRACSIPTAIASEVLTDLEYFSNVEDFTDAISTRIPSSRVSDLTPVVLYGILRGSWFGKNASELVSVAVEHPPTFDALIHAAAGSSSLQRTVLGTLVKAELRDRDAESFVQGINALIIES